MFSLQARMWILLTALFGIIYAIVVMAGTAMGVHNFSIYFIISIGFMVVQYLIGPKMVEWSMKIRYITRDQHPKLFRMVEEQAQVARLPMPKIGISPAGVPNAFAFGRGRKDGRVCVTEGILRLLNDEELRAVIGHELAHIRNRDVLTMTLLSVIPMVMYRIAWHFMFYGGNRSNDRGAGGTALIGLAAFFFYFVTNLLVMYASRIREYFADKGAVEFGNPPAALASALYKLVYGSARAGKESIREVEGMKAFFINDPSRAYNEIRELSQLDMDRSGTIDPSELMAIRNKSLTLGFGDKMMELMSTHPNMLKRIKHLSEQQ